MYVVPLKYMYTLHSTTDYLYHNIILNIITDKTEKLYQYYINWFLTLVIIINSITGYSIALPNLYGFITNPPDASSCEVSI